MGNAIPHLSASGWIKNTSSVVIKLYEYFLTSEYSQSNTFYGEVVSLKYILQNYTSTSDIEQAIRDALNKMYNRYFDTVNVTVLVDEQDNGTSYGINVSVTDADGTTKDLSSDVNTIGNNIVNMDQLLSNLYGEE